MFGPGVGAVDGLAQLEPGGEGAAVVQIRDDLRLAPVKAGLGHEFVDAVQVAAVLAVKLDEGGAQLHHGAGPEGVAPVRSNSINPGATRTSMRAQAYPAETPENNPLPAEIMPVYLYLMGPDSTGVNGQAFDAQ